MQTFRRSALSWLLKFVRRFNLKATHQGINKRNAKPRPPKFKSMEELKEIFKLPEKPTLADHKTHIIGTLMYELGLRRQDVIDLKYKDFMNEADKYENYYRISFYNKKNNKDRMINIPHSVCAKVFEFKAFKEKLSGKSISNDDLILGWTTVFAVQKHFKRHISVKSQEKLKTHDLRIAKACHMYIETGNINKI